MLPLARNLRPNIQIFMAVISDSNERVQLGGTYEQRWVDTMSIGDVFLSRIVPRRLNIYGEEN
ncbi:hypothetical protein GYMLUDRAFT_888276 [Collybiopsis luxurians FD-317 M1]|uniref:Uncharacterized protein n=1 Tax=Collybiopsis luxurians FD-317 M1 TaxID=944289 RepID=A0A0D0AWX3_9AGAR|nr:hypothetical protein GYMLUDRAFT_888276 [Collybiopsis luxurians FD-317 M1]